MRYLKKLEIFLGYVVICNWDGVNLWDGLDFGDENLVFLNIFLILYIGLDVELVDGFLEWMMVVWYYVGDYVVDLEYGVIRGFLMNGIGM